MPALAQRLVQIPCSCGKCGRTAATLRVDDRLPDDIAPLVSTVFSTLRLASSDFRKSVPKMPDGANPLAHVPPEMISSALGIIRPECATFELEESNGRQA